MLIDREFWLNPFPKNHFPNWKCPKCGSGILRPIDRTFAFEEDGGITVERNRKGEYFDRDAYTFRYSVILKCNNPDCLERVASCGRGFVREIDEFSDNEDGSPAVYFEDVFAPEYFYPSLKLFPLPSNCPKSVASKVIGSFNLFFADPPAAANYVRKAVDEILTEKGVPRYTTSNRGKRARITLHDRIVAFEVNKPDIAKKLFAIKWLGNEGSHADTITKNDVLDAYEILEWVIDDLYVRYRESLEKKVSKINKNKKPLHPST
jgi:hypothetical protein